MEFFSEIDVIDYDKSNFINNYVKENKPVIIKNAIQSWPALNKWSLDYLTPIMGDIHLEYRQSLSNFHPDFGDSGKTKLMQGRFTEFLSHIVSKSKDNATYFLSGDVFNLFQKDKLNHKVQALWPDFDIPTCMTPNEIEIIGLWLSTKGVTSWLHYDGNGGHNFNAQIQGQKEVTLIPPSHAKYCYMFPCSKPGAFNFSRANIHQPDYQQFPELKHVIYYKSIIDTADVLYIPPYWLHSFRHLGEVNLNLNFWWHNQYTQLSALALRGQFLYNLQVLLSDSDEPITRKELIGKLNSMSEDVTSIIDRMELAFLNWSAPAYSLSTELINKLKTNTAIDECA